MATHFRVFKVVFFLFVSLSFCYFGFAQPAISNFSPASGSVGTSVTINGTNFNITATNNIVFFGDTKAIVTAATATSLTVTVPAGASYKNISVANITTGLSAYSSKLNSA